MSTLFERIEAEAATAARPGQYARLTDIAAEVQALTDERDRLRRGGAELGKSLKFWMDLAVKATASEDCIEEDGDGDWGAVAERLASMRGYVGALADAVDDVLAADAAWSGGPEDSVPLARALAELRRISRWTSARDAATTPDPNDEPGARAEGESL